MIKNSGILTILFLFFSCFSGVSQTLKTYSGEYPKIPFYLKPGNATYQYYDNSDGEKIYEGDFIFTWDAGNSFYKGKFSDNKQTGLWVLETPKESVKVNFNNGILDGPILMTDSDWKIECIATDGYLNGGFTYYQKSPIKLVIKGQFTYNVPTGTWVITKENEIVKYVFLGFSDFDALSDNKVSYSYKIIKENMNGEAEEIDRRYIKFYKHYDLLDGWKIGELRSEELIYNSLVDLMARLWQCPLRDSQKINPVEFLIPESLGAQFWDELILYTSEDVDTLAEFPGGANVLIGKWIRNNLNYPENALRNGVEGRVILQLIIDKDGSIYDFKIHKGIDPDLDREAIRLVNSMPKWQPAMKDGKYVRQYYTLPVRFNLPTTDSNKK